MNTKGKLYSLIIIMIFCELIMFGKNTVYAADKATGRDKDGHIWTYDYDTDTLTISGKGALRDTDTEDWNSKDNRPVWDKFSETAKHIIIEKGITGIGNENFSFFYRVKDVVIADTVIYIGVDAFDGCVSLTSVTLPDSLLYIGAYAFDWCDIKKIVLPKKLIKMEEGCFEANYNITSVIIPKNLKRINAAFGSVKRLKNIVLPEGLQVIYDFEFAFTNLKSIDIPKSVTTIAISAFNHTKIKNLNIPENVTEIYLEMFSDSFDCYTDEEPGYDKFPFRKIRIYSKKIKYIQKNSFCSLDDSCIIEVPAEKYELYKEMLLNSGLDPNIKITRIKTLKGKDSNGNTWEYDAKTKVLYFSGHGKIEPKLTDGTIDMNGQWYQWAGEAKKIVIKNGITEIGNEAFKNFVNIREVVIAETVNKIGKKAFYGDIMLSQIRIPKSVKTTENDAFYGCIKLKH